MGIILSIILFFCIALCVCGWARLRKSRKNYESMAEAYQEGMRSYEHLKAALDNSVNEWMRGVMSFRASYRLTESDFAKHGNDHQGMEKEAKQRMAGALGRKIVKELGATEVIEDGVLVGFRIDIDAKKQNILQ